MALNHQRPVNTKAIMIQNTPALQPELQALLETLDGAQWQTAESARVTIQETGLVAAAGLDVDTPTITTTIVAVTDPGMLRSGLEIATWRKGVAIVTSGRNAATDPAVAVAVDRLSGDGTGIGSATGNAVSTTTRTELGIGRGLDPAIEITTVAGVIAAGREVVSAIEIEITLNTGLVEAGILALHPDVAPVLDALGLARVLVIATEIVHALDHDHPSLGDVPALARPREEDLDLVIDRERDALRLDPSPLTAICLSPAIGVNHRGVEYALQREMPEHPGLASQTATCPALSLRKLRKEK